jgi:hypothetical protein
MYTHLGMGRYERSRRHRHRLSLYHCILVLIHVGVIGHRQALITENHLGRNLHVGGGAHIGVGVSSIVLLHHGMAVRDVDVGGHALGLLVVHELTDGRKATFTLATQE